MEELSTIFGNVGILVAALAGGISLVMFGFAGIQYMTAQGDPQGMSRAKMSVIGAVVGLAIAGLAFVMPGVISRLIIEPAGGERIVADSTTDCDQLLRNQLVFQRGASTFGRMNEVIRQIQAQRDDCVSELWNPAAMDLAATPTANDCFGTTAPGRDYASPLAVKVGDLTVPRTLYGGFTTNDDVRHTSGRDSDNNIIVYWHNGTSGNPPADKREVLALRLQAEQLGPELLADSEPTLPACPATLSGESAGQASTGGNAGVPPRTWMGQPTASSKSLQNRGGVRRKPRPGTKNLDLRTHARRDHDRKNSERPG